MTTLAVSNVSDASVSVVPDAVSRRDSAIAWSVLIEEVSSTAQQTAAVEAQQELASIVRGVEQSRTAVKAPVLNLGREIDAKAKAFVAPVEAELQRISALVSKYQAEQRRIAALAERERLAKIAEAAAEQRRIAEAEQKRLRDEIRSAEQAAAAERNAVRAAELRRIAEEKQKEQEAAKASENVALDAAIRNAASSVAVSAPIATVAGQIVRNEWRFEVIDPLAVYRARPELCKIEVQSSKVHALIKSGVTDIPGLRVWQETVSGVRV